jgi:hypothetical protein
VRSWLDQNTPEAQKLHNTRDMELYFISKSNMTIVGSFEEAEMIRHYHPDAKVEWAANFFVDGLPQPTCEGRSGALFTATLLDDVANR